MKAILLIFVISFGLSAKNLKILFIGNSYSYFAGVKTTIAKAFGAVGSFSGEPVSTAMVSQPMIPLQVHWEKGEAAKRIMSGDWDYVVLQDNAAAPIDAPEKTLEYAMKFARLIRSVGAEPLLYLTWELAKKPNSQNILNKTYYTVGKKINAKVVPVGPAFTYYYEKYNTLPLRQKDASSHATGAATYLITLCMYAKIKGSIPNKVPISIIPKLKISDKHRSELQATAEQVCL